MTTKRKPARQNQRLRTRKHMLQAAARLMQHGRNPSLEEVAEEALVSRATVYRYFPSAEALLLEASLDLAVPSAEDLFRDAQSEDPVVRVERVDAALHDMIVANEASLRMLLVHSLQRGARGEVQGAHPARQNRRTPLIEAALGPVRTQFKPAALDTLQKALALVVGPEAMVVFKDVLALDDAEIRKVKRWTIRALVDAARKTRSSG